MTEEIRQCYRTLDLDAGASLAEVKAAWRELVKVWHPDRFLNDEKLKAKGTTKLVDINRAYEILAAHLKEPQTSKGSSTAGSPKDKNPRPAGEYPQDSKTAQKEPSSVKPIIRSLIFAVMVFAGLSWLLVVTGISKRGKESDAPAAESTITLIALDTVRLKVVLVSDGRVLFPDTNLSRGQTQVVPKPGPVFITASALENVAVEENGRRTNLRDQGFKGYDRVKLGQ